MRISSILAAWVFAFRIYAASEDSLGVYDNTYYNDLRDKFSVYTYGIIKLNSIEFKNPSSDTIVRYKPNEKFNLGLGFNYKWAGLSAAFNLKFINNDDELHGKTQCFDLQSDFFSRKFLTSVNLQTYKGFFWENINRFDTTWNVRDSVPLRPDIITVGFGVNSIYAFNFEKFSLKAPYVHTEWQKRSAGSWLVGGHLSTYSLTSESLIIPLFLRSAFPVYNRTMNIVTSSIGGSAGYSYTFVFFEEYYINALLMVGISLQSYRFYGPSNRLVSDDVKASTKSSFRLSMGFNNDKCYYGISLISESFPLKNSFQSTFVYNYGRLRLYYGRRFNLNKL